MESPAPAPDTSSSGFDLAVWSLKAVGLSAIAGLGAVYGIAAYVWFSRVVTPVGLAGSGLMLWAFLGGVPLGLGVLVGYLARQRRLAGAGEATLLATLSVGLFVFAAGAMLREGTICIVMAAPIFLVLAALGVVVGGLLRLLPRRQGPTLLSVALFLPLMAAPFEAELASDTRHLATRSSIFIAAPPETVWGHLNFPTDIRPSELAGGWAYRIGVPFPIEGRTLEGRVGGKRELRWQRGVHFDELITDWQPARRIAWVYAFAPDSFPEGSLDDHIAIGGRYFNLESTSYSLRPEAGGTRLTIDVGTSVTTNFNAYAGWWAAFLVGDTAETILRFYKVRAEAGAR